MEKFGVRVTKKIPLKSALKFPSELKVFQNAKSFSTEAGEECLLFLRQNANGKD